MDAIAVQAKPRRARRWVVHVAWGVIALGCLAGGVALGMRWGTMTFTGISSVNDKYAYFARIRYTIDALEADDAGKLRHANAAILSESVASLGALPRYVDCSATDRAKLVRADAWLAAHPLPTNDTYGPVLKLGAQFCDKAPPEWVFP